MFIREVKKRIKTVESVRTENGPRRTVLNLGTLEIDKDKFKSLANSIEAIIKKQNMLLDEDFSRISDHTLHRVADKLFENKDTIEQKLAEKLATFFSLMTVLFFMI